MPPENEHQEGEETKEQALQRQKDEEDDAEMRDAVFHVTEKNKQLDDVYDEKMRVLELKRKLAPTDEKQEEEHSSRVQLAKERYEELKAKISNARRAGKDPLIADFMSRSIPAKIKMADVTREERAFDEVSMLIRKATEELEEAEAEEQHSAKKEMEKTLRHDLQKETGKVADDDE